MIAQITTWQSNHAGEGGGSVPIAEVDHAVELPTSQISIPQLQRIRRQFIALNRQHSLSKARVREIFVDYLNDQFSR